MSDKENLDETSGFICESEDVIEVEAPAQEAEVKDEQASSETPGTEVDASKDPEVKAEGDSESTDKKETDLPGADATADTDKPKKRDGYQKSIDRVTRQREDVKRENETLKRELEELKGKQQKPEDKANEPVEDDFETYDKYLDALDKFDKQPDQPTDKKVEPEKEDIKSKDEGGLTDSQKSAMAVLQERIESSEDKPEDFETVAMAPDVDITGDMLEALAECDDPIKVMQHLGQNKDLATKIANKSTAQQMREIAKLDMTVTSKPKKQIKLTEAPDAIAPVSGSDSQKKSHSEMSFSEFEAEDRARNSKRKSTW
jgi:hypothetical protein